MFYAIMLHVLHMLFIKQCGLIRINNKIVTNIFYFRIDNYLKPIEISFVSSSKQLNIFSLCYLELPFPYMIYLENKRKGKIKGMNV